MNSLTWQSSGGNAFQFVGGEVNASIDLGRTSDGLSICFSAHDAFKQSSSDAIAGSPLMNVLGVTMGEARGWDTARVDSYVRGSDLVATYEGAAPHPLRLQGYWRAIAADDFSPQLAADVLAAFDLIVSVNTSLLDDDPQSAVCGKLLGAAATTEFRHGAFAVRIGDANLTWLEMVHPGDYCHSAAEQVAPDGVGIRHELFRRRLEKGVILRARVRGALVRQAKASMIATAAYERFAAAEPPLTV